MSRQSSFEHSSTKCSDDMCPKIKIYSC